MHTSLNPSDRSLESILQLLKEVTKGSDISPYLAAIQSLNGTKPGEKYKELNLIVKKLVASNNQFDTTSTSSMALWQVPAAMAPLVQLLVAKEVKSFEVVRDALKSEDKTILNHALNTNWFFDASNSHVDVDYFVANIMPYVSERTRFRIIKNLSKSLIRKPIKAENFFTKFTELYGINEAMPLLPACSDDFIFNEILKHKIEFIPRKLLALYKKHPKVVIRYLNLGNKKNESNKKEREIHSISLYEYRHFLPHLIRHNVRDFIELYDQYASKNLGSTLSALLLKNATDEIIKNPLTYLGLLSLKAVCKKLTLEQIEEMYANLLPEKDNQFDFGNMLRYLKYYPKVKRLDLMQRLYKEKYSRDLISGIYNINSTDLDLVYNMISPELFEELFTKALPTKVGHFSVDKFIAYLHLFPREKAISILLEKFESFYGENLLSNIKRIESESLLKLLPSDVRAVQAKRLVDLHLNNDDNQYYKWCCFLPPNESFAIFKEAIAKTSSDTQRYEYIKKMLYSCSIYESTEGLLNVLSYYNTRHKNERIEVLSLVLLYISENFYLKVLDKSHWQILREIMQRAHTKNDLFKMSANQIGPFFGGAVYHLLIQFKRENEEMMPEDEKIFLDKILDMTVDYNIESSDSKWIFIPPCASVQRYCFDRLLKLTVVKYPKEHTIWQSKAGFNRKVKVLTDILNAFNRCNEAIEKFNKASKDAASHIENVKIKDYSWVVELIEELNESSSLSISQRREISHALKRIDSGLSFFVRHVQHPNIESISDVKSGAAWIKLKKDQDDVLANWTEYLTACREKLKFNTKSGALAARRFLLSILWCKDLPIKFVERCLLEVTEVGSIKVLSILLDGETFSKLATLFAPQNSSVDSLGDDSRVYYTTVQSILPAMNFTNPPVPFDVITLFCQGDYTKLAIQAFSHASQRVSRAKIMEFANDIIKKPVSVKKHGIKLIFQVANAEELRKFVEKTWRIETHVSIRELMAQIIQKNFQDNPNEDNWNLIKFCIDGMTVKDEVPLTVLSFLSPLKSKHFCDYLTRLLNKIEELSTKGLDETTTSKLISKAFESITSYQIKFFSEDKIMEYLEKYFFDAKSSKVHSAARNFALMVFNRHFSEHKKA